MVSLVDQVRKALMEGATAEQPLTAQDLHVLLPFAADSISGALSRLFRHENHGIIHRRKIALRTSSGRTQYGYWTTAIPSLMPGEVPAFAPPLFLIGPEDLERAVGWMKAEPAPTVPMILFCPNGHRHIDEGEFANKAHHTHACQECGMVWRPAKVNTHGVQFLPGYKNED